MFWEYFCFKCGHFWNKNKNKIIVNFSNKAMRYTEISKLFVFASFQKVCFLKFGNFSEITSFFKLAKILRKKFRNNFIFLGQKTLFLNLKTLFLNLKTLFLSQKTLFLSQKTLLLGQKVQKEFGNPCFGVRNSHFWKFRTYKNFGIYSFPTFQKLQKNDIKLVLRKSRKTCSNSKTDSNVRFKVPNAGPYFLC